MMGYTVSNSIDLINEYCSNPTKYMTWQLKAALNDARVHYENGNASKLWYEHVVRVLSPYI